MGSNVMEPGDIAVFATRMGLGNRDNITTICASIERIHYLDSLFTKINPLFYSVPLLLSQISISSAAILFTSFLLRPLHQTALVAQMLGGIMLGPSCLGRVHDFLTNLFPLRSLIILDIISSIGYIMFFFLTGVEIDPMTVKKINKSTFATGILTPAVPMVLTEGASYLLVKFVLKAEPDMAQRLPIVAQAESALAIPTVVALLAELSLTNSELGRRASRASMVSGLFSFTVSLSMVLAGLSINDKAAMITMFFTGVVFTGLIVFVVGPLVLRMLRGNPVGVSMKPDQLVAVVLTVLVTGFCSHALGLHIYYGPFILGLTIPSEPPIGFELRERIGYINDSIFLPIFFAKNGLVVDVFSITLKSFAVVQTIALVAALGKFLAAFCTSVYYRMPPIDAIALGLVMSVQGLLELGFFKMLKKDSQIDDESFVTMCLSMVFLRACITPIIKRLYDPSRKYLVYRRRNVSNSKPDADLGILVCLHEEDNVPTTIKLLESLNPNFASPISVLVLHLVELVGLERHLLVPHNIGEIPFSYVGPEEDIFKAFKYYEQSKLGNAAISAYTAMSRRPTMHDDVFALAMENGVSLAILPFYDKFRSVGRDLGRKSAAVMNKNVVDRAPCSIGILVDRGILKSPRPLLGLASWSPYRVGIVFLGGDDDREALAIGTRMIEHPNITVTMIRLLVSGNVAGIDTDERKLDNEFLSEFRQTMARNGRVTYVEEVIMDGSGTVAVLRSLDFNYELVLVGRNHDRQSPMLSGLPDSGDNAELGVIGRIVTSVFRDNATVLVVQQHSKVLNEVIDSRKQSLRGTNSSKSDDDGLASQGRS